MLSSTIKICVVAGTGNSNSFTSGFSAGTSGIVNQNMEPPYGFGLTPISPFIAAIKALQIARPKPVPPYFLEVEASA